MKVIEKYLILDATKSGFYIIYEPMVDTHWKKTATRHPVSVYKFYSERLDSNINCHVIKMDEDFPESQIRTAAHRLIERGNINNHPDESYLDEKMKRKGAI